MGSGVFFVSNSVGGGSSQNCNLVGGCHYLNIGSVGGCTSGNPNLGVVGG